MRVLHVCTEEDESECGNAEDNASTRSPLLSRIHSTKNMHEMRRISLGSPHRMTYERAAKLSKIHKLQKEKQQLMESLEILKNGAVNCIVEKDEAIAELKAILTNNTPEFADARLEEIDKLLQYIKDLESEKAILTEELGMSRRNFERELSEKHSMISELTHELNWSYSKISNLERYDELLLEKIKALEDNNENLSVLLNHSQETLKASRSVRETDSNDLLGSQTGDAVISMSQVSSIPSNLSCSHGRVSTHSLHSIDEQLIECKIQELKQQHELEMADLARFYENRIDTLKQICSHEYDNYQVLPHPFDSLNLKAEKAAEDVSCRSGLSNNRVKSLSKNLSLSSLKSQG